MDKTVAKRVKEIVVEQAVGVVAKLLGQREFVDGHKLG
jgi:hypothetical protein